MFLRAPVLCCLIVALTAGCGDEPEPVVEPLPSAGCVPGERPLDDGQCQPAGIPSDGCGEGFVHDGDHGCEPLLPATACAFGTMAVPGDIDCREIAPCGEGAWGTIPVDGTTEHVDQSYTGGGSDGSAAMPWTTISEGITAAAPGAIVAVAPGSYVETLAIQGKPVRLWGKCPSEVEVVTPDGDMPVLRVLDGAAGTEVRAIALRGAASWPAVGVGGSDPVLLSQVWIHDNGTIGLYVTDQGGAAGVTLADSLIEAVGDVGVLVEGAALSVERSVIRDTVAGPLGVSGRGINLETNSDTGARSTGLVRQSLLERTPGTAVFVGDSDASVIGSVIRDIGAGVVGAGLGRGINVERISTRGSCVVRQSLVERVHDVGIYAASADLSVELSVVRDTLVRDSDQLLGRGINVETVPGGEASSFLLSSSLVERAVEVGVVVSDGVATIESTLVRDMTSSPVLPHYGCGITIQRDLLAPPPEVVVRWLRVERCRGFGALVQSANVTFESLWISDIRPVVDGGDFGDAMAISDMDGPAWMAVTGARFEQSARAGVALFGGEGHLAQSEFECNAIHLTGQPMTADFQLVDEGGNSCGCGPQEDSCVVLSAALVPPDPLGATLP